MKRVIFQNCLFLVIAILGISCSTSSNFSGDEEKVRTLTIQSHGYPTGMMNVTEIKFIRNITVEDSINYFLKESGDIIISHTETLQKLSKWNELKESKTYSEWDVDAEIKKLTDELNKYSDAYEGKLTDNSWKFKYVYQKIYEFRQMDKDNVLGKIYSITYTLGKSKPVTDIQSFNADITKSIATYGYIEAVKQPIKGDLESIHFVRYNGNTNETEVPQTEFIHEGGDIIEPKE